MTRVRSEGAIARLRRLDPLTGLAGVVALAVFLLHRWDSVLSRDLALYSYAGQQVADGVPPYVGVLNRAGPLAHMLPAVGVLAGRALGVDEVLSMRVFYMLVSVAAVCVAYLLGRDVFESRLAGLATAATLLSFHAFVLYATGGPREKTPMLLFILCALWAAVHRRWFTAGVLVGLATLTLQIAFFFTFPAVLFVILICAKGERLRAMLRVVVGGLVPLVVFAGYFLAVGAFRPFLDGFLLLNARYQQADTLLPRLGIAWESMQEGYGLSLWFLLLGLALVIGFAVVATRSDNRRRSPWLGFVAALALAVLVDFVWNLRDFDSWADAIPVLPVAALGLGAAARALQERMPSRVALGVATAWLALALASTFVYSITEHDATLIEQRRSVEAVLGVLPPDATVLSVEAPGPLVLSGRTNPTRYQMFTGGMWKYVDREWPGGMDGFRSAMLEKERPPIVAIYGDRLPAWKEALDKDYAHIGTAPYWEWYARRSLGPETLAALKDAASDAEGSG